MAQIIVHLLCIPRKGEGAVLNKCIGQMYFERYLEFSNLTWPRQMVSSEFCIAEKDSLLGVHKQAMSTGHFHGLLKCKDTTSLGYFWEPSIFWGCDVLFLSAEHLRALTGFSCLVSSYEAQRVSKPLKYDYDKQ